MTRATPIPLDKILDNPFQPRTSFDPEALRSLADEIKAEGFWAGSLQGRRTTNGQVEIVFGHRRLRALRMLNAETVPIEIVDLTDAQMALRSLEENLQRQGLTDLEKADAVKRAVEIVRGELRANGNSESHAVQQVANRLGLTTQWVGQLCQISETIVSKNRAPVEAKHISAKTAFLAKTWGGDAYVKALAKQGEQAANGGTVAKPTEHTVAGMKRVVTEAPEGIREKLKTAIIAGAVTTPAEAEQKGRRLAAEHTKREQLPPPDLHIVIIGWTHRLAEWDEQLEKLAPYRSDVQVPEIATRFRAALAHFIATAETWLEDEPAPLRAIGKGQTSAAATGVSGQASKYFSEDRS